MACISWQRVVSRPLLLRRTSSYMYLLNKFVLQDCSLYFAHYCNNIQVHTCIRIINLYFKTAICTSPITATTCKSKHAFDKLNTHVIALYWLAPLHCISHFNHHQCIVRVHLPSQKVLTVLFPIIAPPANLLDHNAMAGIHKSSNL